MSGSAASSPLDLLYLLLVVVVVGILVGIAGAVVSQAYLRGGAPAWVGVAMMIVGAVQSAGSLLLMRRLFPATSSPVAGLPDSPAPASSPAGSGS